MSIEIRNFRWEIETIPITAKLYRRVHFNNVDEICKRPAPGCFKETELSCDWNKYATPQQSHQLIGREYKKNTTILKDPNDFFICSLSVGDIVKNTTNQLIVHNPILHRPQIVGVPNNRAHSLVKGEKDIVDEENIKIRYWLSKFVTWELFDEKKCEGLKKRNRR